MSFRDPRRNFKLPHEIEELLGRTYAGNSGLSGPELVDFFRSYIPDLEPYPREGAPPGRYEILVDCLARLDLEEQKRAIRELLEYDGPMKHGQPRGADKARIREWLRESDKRIGF